jgi:hypothetical protein
VAVSKRRTLRAGHFWAAGGRQWAVWDGRHTALEAEVDDGGIVVLEDDRVRVRSLPIGPRAPRKTRENPRTGRHGPAQPDPPHPS